MAKMGKRQRMCKMARGLGKKRGSKYQKAARTLKKKFC